MRQDKRAILLSLAGNATSPVVGLITAPLLAQELGATGRGELAGATAALLLIGSVAAAGMPEAVIYFIAGRRMSSPRLLGTVVWSSAVAAIIGVVAMQALASPLSGGSSELAKGIVTCSFFLPGVLLVGLTRAIAAAEHRWDLVTYERVTSALLRLSGLVALSILGELSVSRAVYIFCVSYVVGVAVYLRALPQLRPRLVSIIDLQTVVKYAFVIWFGSVAGYLLLRVDQVLLPSLAGTYQLGLYALAASLSEIPLIFNSAVRDVTFSRQAEQLDVSLLARYARQGTLLTLLAAAALGMLFPIISSPLFGEQFVDAAVPLWILLSAVCIGNPGSIAGAGLQAAGRPVLRSISLVAALCLNIACLYPLAKAHGAAGAALATLFANSIAGFMNVWFATRLPQAANAAIGDFYLFKARDWHDLKSLIRVYPRRTHE